MDCQAGVRDPQEARVPGAASRVRVREAESVGMSRREPVPSARRAGEAQRLVAANQEPPDYERQQGSSARSDATDSAAVDPADVVTGPLGRDGTPYARLLSALVRLMRSKLVRLGFLAVLLALLAFALVDQAGTLWREIQRLTAPVVLLAFAASLGGLLCSPMVWREVAACPRSPPVVAPPFPPLFIRPPAEYTPP